MALTLNGIAQGYVADRVVALLRGMGLDRVLVNTGEYAALGGDPRGGAWQVGLRAGDALLPQAVALDGAGLATSSMVGTTFDSAGRAGHILDPRTGRPGPRLWRLVSVTAPRAALADALSTAFCLMDGAGIDAVLRAFPSARVAALVPDGST
jgi:thiamine biosynthesis lipoprotein